MSGAIGPGVLVQALRPYDEVGIAVGDTGVVDEVVSADRIISSLCPFCGEEGDGFTLRGVALPGEQGMLSAFCPCGWKPISGGERGMFDHMLKLDAPSKEPVAA